MDESEIELEYRSRIDSMSAVEKTARMAAMFEWTRQQMARQLRKAKPELTDEQIKWQIALKIYEREPEVVRLIKDHLQHVSC